MIISVPVNGDTIRGVVDDMDDQCIALMCADGRSGESAINRSDDMVLAQPVDSQIAHLKHHNKKL